MSDQLRYSIAYFFICYSILFICKKLSIRGTIAPKGPLILCGTHFNCFLDGLFLLNLASRRISLLVSSNVNPIQSYNQKVGGYYMRQVSSIPINRPMDKRFMGKGEIKISNTQVLGQNSSFNSEVHAGDYIAINGKEFRVVQVLSDFELKILESFHQDEWIKFHVYPKRDNSECMKLTNDRLKSDHAVLIFPEGETHEQPAMLTVKGGIASIVLNSLASGINPDVQCFSYIISSPGKFRTKSELLISEPLKFDPSLLNLEKSEACRLIIEKITQEMNEIRLPAETLEEIELAIFIAKLKKLKDFETNKLEILREILLRIKGTDENLINQMRKIKMEAQRIGVSKYAWDMVDEFEYKMNMLFGVGLTVIFGGAILAYLGMYLIINSALNKYEKEVLVKLPYRKCTIDCFATWRLVFICLIIPACVLLVFCFLVFYLGSISGAILGTMVAVVYASSAVFALDMIKHAKKVVKRFKIGDSEEISQLDRLKAFFIEDIKLKYGL